MLRLLCVLSSLQALTACLERQRAGRQTVDEEKGIPVPGARPPPTLCIFSCTLEELYRGTTKGVDVNLQELDVTGMLAQISRTYHIKVSPGWKKGTRIIFAGQGDQDAHGDRRDLAFVLDELPHPVFRRDGNNLVVQHTVHLADALSGFTATLTHLDGRRIPVTVDVVVGPGSTRVVRGEGMPSKAGRGDLIVEFDVEFPTTLKPKDRCLRLMDPTPDPSVASSSSSPAF
jgi:DnaJ family protein B protein 4